MSGVSQIIKAIKIKLMLNRLSKAKENAMREFLGLPPKISWYDECSDQFMTCVKDKFCQIMFPCCIYDRNRRLKRPTCWNSPTLREFTGFLGGVLLTLLLYLMLVYQMEVEPKSACSFCVILGFVLTLLLAFSLGCRCLVLLMLPQFFSGTGRTMLLVYALYLAMNNPLRNINANISVLSQSTSCGQEQALNSTKELLKAAVAPMESIIDSVQAALKKLCDFGAGLRDMYLSLKKSVKEIGNAITDAGKFLKSMVGRCNKVIGKPYHTCKHEFQRAKERCKDALSIFGFICNIMDVIDEVCNIVRIGELMCIIVDAIKKLLENSFSFPVEASLDKAKEMFYFDVSVKYHFNYTITQSKSYKQVKEGIQKEIHVSIDKFIQAIVILKDVMVITVMFVFIKAVLYRSRWLSEDRFDNMYITFLVRDLDERRIEKCKPGILPLKYDERWQYVSSVSGRMVKKELKKLGFGLMFFIISMFNAAFYLMCDWGLYSALSLIQFHYSIISKPPVPPHTKMYVEGRGPMADMYRAIVGMFDPISDSKIKVDVSSCVPRPSEPDWDVYRTIVIIYVICLLLTITEAYGLRLRHMIMACYNPRKERKRALWLYNHILKLRGGIMDSTKRTIRKRKLGQGNQQNISLKGQLAASFPACERLLKWLGWDMKSCIYCGAEGKPDDYTNFIHCGYPDCDAVYCLDCYADLDNQCAACTHAVEGKTSDSSEAEDSSVDEKQMLMKMAQKKYRSRKVAAIKAERRPSRRLANLRNQFGMPDKTNPSRYVDSPDDDSESDENVLFSAPLLKQPKSRQSLHSNRSNNNLKSRRKRRSQADLKLAMRNINRNAVESTMSDDGSGMDSECESADNLSSSNSVDTDNLDFDYQYKKKVYTDDSGDSEREEDINVWKPSRGIDLVSEDIFTSDTASDVSDPEPGYLVILRE